MSRAYYWNRTCDWYSQYLTVLCWEVRSYGVRKFFVNDFLQLTHSFLTFFLTLYCCIKFLTFPKIVFLYFHIEIPLEIGCKFNIYETYVRSMYILFPGGCEEASKPVLLDNNMLKVNHKCTKTRSQIHSSLTMKSNATDTVFEPLLLTFSIIFIISMSLVLFTVTTQLLFFLYKITCKLLTKVNN